MKELDVLLERFLARYSTELAAGRWPELEALLELEDDQLWELLRDPTTPQAVPYRSLLEAICRA